MSEEQTQVQEYAIDSTLRQQVIATLETTLPQEVKNAVGSINQLESQIQQLENQKEQLEGQLEANPTYQQIQQLRELEELEGQEEGQPELSGVEVQQG